jgi:hypothetical protein
VAVTIEFYGCDLLSISILSFICNFSESQGCEAWLCASGLLVYGGEFVRRCSPGVFLALCIGSRRPSLMHWSTRLFAHLDGSIWEQDQLENDMMMSLDFTVLVECSLY